MLQDIRLEVPFEAMASPVLQSKTRISAKRLCLANYFNFSAACVKVFFNYCADFLFLPSVIPAEGAFQRRLEEWPLRQIYK